MRERKVENYCCVRLRLYEVQETSPLSMLSFACHTLPSI
jgi:hypothetical protein